MIDIQFGLMVRAQFPAGDDMQVRFAELVEQARLADRLGYSCLTTGMHYSSAPLQDFQQIPFLVRMMSEAPNLRLNFGVVLLSLHKPLDIAETLASIDVMSGGRVIFGAALGYREVEFKAFGTTQADRVRRFEENLVAVKRLWTEDSVDMVGSHFELDGASVSLRPVQQPHPPIWIGANADAAIERAARLGDCWYVNPHNRIDTVVRQTEYYRSCLDAMGKPFPTEFPARREVFVADSHEAAVAACGPHLSVKYDAYRSWGQDKAMPQGDDHLSEDFDELARGRFLVGSSDEVAEGIVELHRATGINHLVMSMQSPGMQHEWVLEGMQRFAEDVMPKVRAA